MDIIMLALPRWDGPYSSTAFSMAKELAKGNRVFYIDNPFTFKDVITGFRSKQIRSRLKSFVQGQSHVADLAEAGCQLVCVTPPPMLPVNFLSAGSLYNRISSVNDDIFFSAIRRLMKTYKISEFIYVNVYNPFYGQQFPTWFKPRTFIYYSVDNIGQSQYVSKHGPRLEAQMMRKADLALTTSRELWNQARRKTSSAYYLPNAADIALFVRKEHTNNIERPPEFRSVSTPIIIYTGHIDVRLDYDLIKAILQHHPDKTLAMVGPHSISKTLYEELKAYPNMLFVGSKTLSQLPAYLHHSHCAIIPFKCNELTKSIYPLKVNEYLAAGLPVVSSAFSEDIQGFRDVVDIGFSEMDFCHKISSAIRDDHDTIRSTRMRVASGNNWANRVQRFWEIVGKFTGSQPQLNSIAPTS